MCILVSNHTSCINRILSIRYYNMAEYKDPNVSTDPVSHHALIDQMQFGGTYPNYTWRKGGTSDPEDNHLWLITGNATDLIIPEKNALIEIDPDSKTIKFWGTTHLMDKIEFEPNSLGGNIIADGTITTDKLAPNIVINGSITALTNARSINGVEFNGTSNVINYALCTTTSTIGAKTVNIPNFKLIEGASVSIQFVNENVADKATLNISGSGAKPIVYHGAPLPNTFIKAKSVYNFVYDGEAWNMVGDNVAVTTDNKVEQTLIDTDGQFPILLSKNANQNSTIVDGINYGNLITINPSNGKLTVPHIVSKISGALPSINNQSTGSIINIDNNGNIVGISSHKLRDGTIAMVSGLNNGITVNYTTKEKVDTNSNEPTYQATLLDNQGNASFPNTVKAKTFEGVITEAVKATQDGKNRTIDQTYLTKEEGDAKFVNIGGDTMTGILRVPQIAGEANTNVSTVGWTQSEIEKAKRQLKDEIIGGTDGSFETIKELTELVKNNKDIITTLQNATNEFVSFNKKQNLNDAQKTTAVGNIGALSTKGGTIDGNITINQSLKTLKPIEVGGGIVSVNNSVSVGINPQNDSTVSYSITDNTKRNNFTEIISKVDTHGNVTSELRAKANTLDSAPASIVITSNIDGSSSVTVPSPSVTSNDASVATTGWVNDRIDLAKNNILDKKTYTNIKAGGPSIDQGMMYFAKITPNNATTSYRVKFTFLCNTPFTDYNCSGVCEIIGVGQKYSYKYWIDRANDNIIAFEGINVKLATLDSLGNGQSHYVAFSLTGSTNATNSGYERSFIITAYENDDCSIELLNNMSSNAGGAITTSSHLANNIVSVAKSGLYYTSTVVYGDRLAHWDRLPVAGSEGLVANSLVVMGEDRSLYSLVKKDRSITSMKFDPSSLMYYQGPDLKAAAVGNKGQLYSCTTVDGASALNIDTKFGANQQVYIEGTLDPFKWLFTAEKFVDRLPSVDTKKQYILVGYSASQGTNNVVLVETHTLFVWNGAVYTQGAPYPFIATGDLSDISDRASTTKFVKTNISQSWINPSVTSDVNNTRMYIRAKDGLFTSGQLAQTEYTTAVVFTDGTKRIETGSFIGKVEASIDNVGQGIIFGAPNPANPDDGAYMQVVYEKIGDQWKPYMRAIQPPSTTDSSDCVATTKYVQDNLVLIDGGIIS